MLYIVDDNQSRETSLSLYRYVCHHVVGTEKTVKTRRLLNTINDNLFHSKEITQITSGSSGEGLEMKGSDVDVMLVFKDVNVYEDINSALVNSAETCVAMEMDDTNLGFSRLRLLRCNNVVIFKMCKKVGKFCICLVSYVNQCLLEYIVQLMLFTDPVCQIMMAS